MSYTVPDILISLIRSEICGEELKKDIIDSVTPDVLKRIFVLSKSQDISCIAASALISNGLVPDGDAKTAFSKEQMTSVFRYAQQRHELERMSRALEAAEIDHIPLKGSVLRAYYPKPEFRTSCDIDVYVRESDLPRAEKVMIEVLKYQFDIKTPHDISYFSQSKTHIELHHDFFENGDSIRKMMSDIWNMSHPDVNMKHRYVMNNDIFVAYHIAHMAKHFSGGGCGIRPFIDLWIITEKMGYDREKVLSLLEACELDKFAIQAISLSNAWFGTGEHNELTRVMAEYITDSAIYGTLENTVAIKQARRGGKLGYIMGRLFMPYSKMKKIYPSLKKCPLLLPFCWIHRWFGFFRRGRGGRAMEELKLNSSVSKDKQKRLVSMLDELGLK